MTPEARRLLIRITCLALFVLLLGITTGCAGSPPKARLSWQEQLSLVQSAVSAEHPKAVLDSIFAQIVFDPERATDRSDQAVPFPITEVKFDFLDSDGETISLIYFDVLSDSLIMSKDWRMPSENTVESKVELTQLPTMVRVGPLEACLSTLEIAQQILNAKATTMDCGVSLKPYGVWSGEFQVPTVWSLNWTSYQKKKESDSISIYINAETGERLKMMQDGVEIKP